MFYSDTPGGLLQRIWCAHSSILFHHQRGRKYIYYLHNVGEKMTTVLVGKQQWQLLCIVRGFAAL